MSRSTGSILYGALNPTGSGASVLSNRLNAIQKAGPANRDIAPVPNTINYGSLDLGTAPTPTAQPANTQPQPGAANTVNYGSLDLNTVPGAAAAPAPAVTPTYPGVTGNDALDRRARYKDVVPPAPQPGPAPPLWGNYPYQGLDNGFPAGDPYSYLKATGLPGNIGIPNLIDYQGKQGFVVQVDPVTGKGRWVDDPNQIFTPQRGYYDQDFYDEAWKAGDRNVHSFLTEHGAGSVLDQGQADELKGYLDRVDPSGALSKKLQENVRGEQSIKPGYSILGKDTPYSTWNNLGLGDWAKNLGWLSADQMDLAGAAGGGTGGTDPGDWNSVDIQSLLKELSDNEQQTLLNLGLSGVLGGRTNNTDFSPAFMSAMLSAMGSGGQTDPYYNPIPLNQQPALTSVPLG